MVNIKVASSCLLALAIVSACTPFGSKEIPQPGDNDQIFRPLDLLDRAQFIAIGTLEGTATPCPEALACPDNFETGETVSFNATESLLGDPAQTLIIPHGALDVIRWFSEGTPHVLLVGEMEDLGSETICGQTGPSPAAWVTMEMEVNAGVAGRLWVLDSAGTRMTNFATIVDYKRNKEAQGKPVVREEAGTWHPLISKARTEISDSASRRPDRPARNPMSSGSDPDQLGAAAPLFRDRCTGAGSSGGAVGSSSSG